MCHARSAVLDTRGPRIAWSTLQSGKITRTAESTCSTYRGMNLSVGFLFISFHFRLVSLSSFILLYFLFCILFLGFTSPFIIGKTLILFSNCYLRLHLPRFIFCSFNTVCTFNFHLFYFVFFFFDLYVFRKLALG